MKKRTEFPIGKKFGMLTITAVQRSPNGRRWDAVCDCACGTKGKAIFISHVESGGAKSCGCGQAKSNYKHGMKGTRTWRRWQGMRTRVRNTHPDVSKYYADKGIAVCARWEDKTKGFINFLADMGECPEGLELDRLDGDKSYSPNNCHWATKSYQNHNRNYESRSRSPYHNVRPYGRNKWIYTYTIDGVRHDSKPYLTADDAALAYNQIAPIMGRRPIKEVLN